ncbi:MAG: Pyruvate dehydrogenase (acetyl-transferring) [Firmicutes bacterium]|nr:Pyruvate dehydrogenase (acetyl-transferring) [Bacillota bacterium]
MNECFLGGELPGFVHLYIGEEAIATGLLSELKQDDYITSTHRGHGHCIAKGAKIKPMMAEIFGKSTGYCKGKGGSMHIADFSVGMLGANGVVGGGINLAVGAALASKMKKSGQVAVTFFGDGGANRGTVHEGMNMAAIWKLPVIFVCEFNEYASTTPSSYGTSVPNVSSRAQGYGMPSAIVDGNDVFAVNEASKIALDYVRSGKGPYMLEFKTYRVKGHFVGDPEMYRSKQEVQDHFENNDPIKNFTKVVLAKKWLSQKELDTIHAEVEQEVTAAVDAARTDPYPADSELFNDYYVEGGVR